MALYSRVSQGGIEHGHHEVLARQPAIQKSCRRCNPGRPAALSRTFRAQDRRFLQGNARPGSRSGESMKRLHQDRLDRREFLAAVGRSAGGTAMLRSMLAMGIATAAGCGSSSAGQGGGGAPPPPAPPPPPSSVQSPRPGDWPANVGSGRSVVILGAGIAGMTAALELGRLGYTCTILEASDRAGGRNRTLRGGDLAVETDSTQTCSFDVDPDLYFNPGPARIPHHHEFLLGYCREFGVALEPFVNSNRAALLHSSSAFSGQPQVTRQITTDLRGGIADLLASAIDRGALDQQLSAADRVNLLAMLRNFGALDGSNDYRGSSRAGFPGQESRGSRQRGELLPPRDLVDLISTTFFQSRSDFAESLDQQSTMLQPTGGMDRIADAFAANVSATIELEAVVSEIRKTASGARVVYADRFGTAREIVADHCVCTIPATVLRNIPNDFSSSAQYRDRCLQLHAGDQDCVSVSTFLGAGQQYLRRYLLDGSGHHADLVSECRLRPSERNRRRVLHIRRSRGQQLYGSNAAAAHQLNRNASKCAASGLRVGGGARDQCGLA